MKKIENELLDANKNVIEKCKEIKFYVKLHL